MNLRKIQTILREHQYQEATAYAFELDEMTFLELRNCEFDIFPPEYLEDIPFHSITVENCKIKHWHTDRSFIRQVCQLKIIHCNASKFPWPYEKFPFLKILDLSQNRIAQFTLDLDYFPKLDALNLANNPALTVNTTEPPLPRLRQIDISATPAKNIAILQKAPSIVSAGVASMQISTIPLEILALHRLRTINISHNPITHLPIERFATSWLESLQANNAAIEGITGKDPQFKYIYEISLQNNRLAQFPAILQKCPNLQYLILNSNNIPSIPAWITTLTKLKHLDVAANPLRAFPKNLVSMGINSLCINNSQNNPLIAEILRQNDSRKADFIEPPPFCITNIPAHLTANSVSASEDPYTGPRIEYGIVYCEKEPPPIPPNAIEFGKYPERLLNKIRYNTPLTKLDAAHPFTKKHRQYILNFCAYHTTHTAHHFQSCLDPAKTPPQP